MTGTYSNGDRRAGVPGGPARGGGQEPRRPWKADRGSLDDADHTVRVPREPGAGGFDRYDEDGFQRTESYAQHEPPPRRNAGTRQYEQPDRDETRRERPRREPPRRQQSTWQQRLRRATRNEKPKKLTVTRVAAWRSRQLSGRAVDAFQRAHKADGADESGLTALSWALMLNYASDAALAVALANTLFFSAASAESREKVLLYLLITIAPFAVVAPLIGPALDKIQRGRRLAMAVSSAGQALACIIIAAKFHTWMLYPAALASMVLSRSFIVLKSAVTPRVVPPEITLSKTNARLTVFGLAAAGAGGGVASGFSWAFGSAGALVLAALICVAGAWQAMRIPSWVESTEGEERAPMHTQVLHTGGKHVDSVSLALWGNATIRLLTGFLTLFAAFAVKAETEANGQSATMQLMLLGLIGAGAGAGGFLGNAIGSRLQMGTPDQIIIGGISASLAATILASAIPGIWTAALVALVGATASALAKISVDAVIQRDLPEQSRASAFGKSETVLQLAWCIGGAIGLLLPPTYWIGFLTVSVLVAVGLTQTCLVLNGKTMVPKIKRRPKAPKAPKPAKQKVKGRR